jgi:hypothetical protein
MSVSITTYPAQSPIFPARTSAASTLPWRFWSTLGWAVVASVIMARGWSFVTTASAWLQLNPAIVGYLGPIIPYAGVTAFLVLVARWRGPSAGAYLGLVWPRWYHIIISVALFVAFRLGLEALSSSPSGARASAESISAYRAIMGNPVALAFYWITVVVKAPVTDHCPWLSPAWLERKQHRHGQRNLPEHLGLRSGAYAIRSAEHSTDIPHRTCALPYPLVDRIHPAHHPSPCELEFHQRCPDSACGLSASTLSQSV